MIYCVRFGEVVEALERDGFIAGSHLLVAVGRVPNLDGNLPEMLVNDAFEAAGLTSPRWDVFWCD